MSPLECVPLLFSLGGTQINPSTVSIRLKRIVHHDQSLQDIMFSIFWLALKADFVYCKGEFQNAKLYY